MSRDGSVSFDWADGTYRFRLAIGELRELHELVNEPRIRIGAPSIGPRTLYDACKSLDIWPHELSAVVRLGLIGGGQTPDKARDLARRYVEARPIEEGALPARLILGAALFGVEDEPLGKQVAPKDPPEGATPSPSAPSTEPAPRSSDGAPITSTASASGSFSPPSRATGKRTTPRRKAS